MQAYFFTVFEPKKRRGNYVTKGVIMTAETDIVKIREAVFVQMKAYPNATCSIQPLNPDKFVVISKG